MSWQQGKFLWVLTFEQITLKQVKIFIELFDTFSKANFAIFDFNFGLISDKTYWGISEINRDRVILLRLNCKFKNFYQF